jgi:outer membrane protein OmpA-like peptidoglycan-associated protein
MVIAGFSDHIGSESYNQRLSQRRADRVKKYMIDKGIQPDRILARGFGEEIPEVMTYDKTELQRNRRVEFNLTR